MQGRDAGSLVRRLIAAVSAPDPFATLAADLAGVVQAAFVTAEPVQIGPAASPLLAEIELLGAELSERHAGAKPAEIAELAPARRLYRSFGVDPTKTRPSSESLLRRVLSGKPFPAISNAVDLSNLLALRFLLPIGLYDRAKLDGPIVLRAGNPGETYDGIRKAAVHLEGRPTLADRRGPFGNPTSDSLRASVDDAACSLLLVVFAPADFPTEALEAHAAECQRGLRVHLAGARPVESDFFLLQ